MPYCKKIDNFINGIENAVRLKVDTVHSRSTKN